ncbi:DUF1983 domain-containing protein [Comamonas sp. Z1]|uniref:phage tail tip fiber protein n=1 Tax=Comamonas sp. Z1 TaxID=2601246 RepID=UPI0011E62159|nr:DUF1983 domain-containing protein [Comamonas sp. Z1]TYK70273.1 DUF1983 domain-containing protein [Comamonas sp. Z1]
MTNEIRQDTGAAKLPAIPVLQTADKGLNAWAAKVAEWLEVRSGDRGNSQERVVTVRELREAMAPLAALSDAVAGLSGGDIGNELGTGLTASAAVDRFAQSILNTRLFKDLVKSLNDPARFDDLPEEIRNELKRDLIDEARRLGAAIEKTESLIQNNERSMAMVVRQLTASLRNAHAGVRETSAAWSDGSKAFAVKVEQLAASVDNYYKDGSAGIARLEEQMTVQADYSNGLRAQYTMKVQAGGALAGYGIAAEEVNGKTSSAFIIMADKFAVVAPSYNAGQLVTPRAQDVVFGVDANGIYLQNNVYIKGNMRLDGTTRVLSDGLRGSVQLGVSAAAWSDTSARQAVWLALGKTLSAPNNNHLVIGDMVTITLPNGTAVTRYWNGAAWVNPGVMINGELLVDGSVSARHINTNGLVIRDAKGEVILSSGGMDASWVKNLLAGQVGGLGGLATQDGVTVGQVSGLGSLATKNGVTVSDVSGLGSLATKNIVSAADITGLGSLATQNYTIIGSTVRMPDGSVMGTGDFVSRLSKIEQWNVSTFIASGAIGRAYIGKAAIGSAEIDVAAVRAIHINDAEIDELKIKGGSVTSMIYGAGGATTNSVGTYDLAVIGIEQVTGGTGFVVMFGVSGTAAAAVGNPNGQEFNGSLYANVQLLLDGSAIASFPMNQTNYPSAVPDQRHGVRAVFVKPGIGSHQLVVRVNVTSRGWSVRDVNYDAWVSAVGGKR